MRIIRAPGTDRISSMRNEDSNVIAFHPRTPDFVGFAAPVQLITAFLDDNLYRYGP
jgi:hypothetical protein